jgi:hypothetical protein
MEIVRMPVGEQALADADCIRSEGRPGASYERLEVCACSVPTDRSEAAS